jgi:hypothetical protein
MTTQSLTELRKAYSEAEGAAIDAWREFRFAEGQMTRYEEDAAAARRDAMRAERMIDDLEAAINAVTLFRQQNGEVIEVSAIDRARAEGYHLCGVGECGWLCDTLPYVVYEGGPLYEEGIDIG